MGQFPVLLFGGELSLQTQSGKLVKIMLSTHEISQNIHQVKLFLPLRQFPSKNDFLHFLLPNVFSTQTKS